MAFVYCCGGGGQFAAVLCAATLSAVRYSTEPSPFWNSYRKFICSTPCTSSSAVGAAPVLSARVRTRTGIRRPATLGSASNRSQYVTVTKSRLKLNNFTSPRPGHGAEPPLGMPVGVSVGPATLTAKMLMSPLLLVNRARSPVTKLDAGLL